jgi:hypothetical protein
VRPEYLQIVETYQSQGIVYFMLEWTGLVKKAIICKVRHDLSLQTTSVIVSK